MVGPRIHLPFTFLCRCIFLPLLSPQASKEPRLRLEQLALAATGAAAGMTSTAAGEAAADGGAWRFLLAGIAIRQATAHFFLFFLF